MTEAELGTIVRAIAPVVRECVAKSIADLRDRLIVMETKATLMDIKAPMVGHPGPPGDRGPEGAPGALGPAGHDGRDGSSLLTGIGPPSADARPGDAYLDVKTGDIYQCR
jgi:hypothetical protein